MQKWFNIVCIQCVHTYSITNGIEFQNVYRNPNIEIIGKSQANLKGLWVKSIIEILSQLSAWPSNFCSHSGEF